MFDPIAFSLFGFGIHWYGITYSVGFLFSYFFLMYFADKFGFEQTQIENIFLSVMIFSVIGGRIFQIIFYEPVFYFRHPLQIFAVWNGGMSIHGGILFGFLTLFYFSKKYKLNLLALTDFFVVPAILGFSFGRLANFVNQELVGKITTSVAGVVFPLYDNKLRWPTTIFESVKNMAIFQLLFYFSFFKKFKTGTITALFLILYNFLRFFIDFLRVPDVSFGFISMGQLLSLVFGAWGVWLLYNINNS